MSQIELRRQLADARRALRHAHSLCRALAGNPVYGICRYTAEGHLVGVNLELAAMLGYTSREELLAVNQQTNMIPVFRRDLSVAAALAHMPEVEAIEVDWKHKSGAILKIRLSGHDVENDYGGIGGYEVIAVDVTKQRTLEEQLRSQASSDSLTGLANHRRLLEVLHAEIARSQRTGRGLSLVLLDLDGLKRINGRFGHLGGDRALCRLGEILNVCCRTVDTAARHGGDEFALVLPETGKVAAALAARRICELLESQSEQPALSASAGVATYPRDADSVGALLEAADKSLYQMKSGQEHFALRVLRSRVNRMANR